MSMDGVPYIRICIQGEVTGCNLLRILVNILTSLLCDFLIRLLTQKIQDVWESAFPASLTGSGSYGWYEGKCCGIRCNGVTYKESKK